MKYTLIWLLFDDEMLMLNRLKKPNMGLWNGVGGKVEANETPLQSAIRETREETGIQISHLDYRGTIFFENGKFTDEMHVYFHRLSSKPLKHTPIQTDEGVLQWQKIDWVLNPGNVGVAPNISYFLPSMLRGDVFEHHFRYEGAQLIDYQVCELLKAHS